MQVCQKYLHLVLQSFFRIVIIESPKNDLEVTILSNQKDLPNGKSKCKLHLSLEQRKQLLELLRQSCKQARIAEMLGVATITSLSPVFRQEYTL